MTHDEFLKALAEFEPPNEGTSPSLEASLPKEAAAHAAGCEDCARTAEALLLLATDEEALHDEPPAEYWQDFDSRLSARIARLEPATPAPVARRSPWPKLLQAAAVLTVVVGLAALALRGFGTAPDTRAGSKPTDESELLANSAEIDDVLATWSEDSTWATEAPASEHAFATLESDETLPGLLRSPAETLNDELSLELDDAQAAELARRLRAEMTS